MHVAEVTTHTATINDRESDQHPPAHQISGLPRSAHLVGNGVPNGLLEPLGDVSVGRVWLEGDVQRRHGVGALVGADEVDHGVVLPGEGDVAEDEVGGLADRGRGGEGEEEDDRDRLQGGREGRQAGRPAGEWRRAGSKGHRVCGTRISPMSLQESTRPPAMPSEGTIRSTHPAVRSAGRSILHARLKVCQRASGGIGCPRHVMLHPPTSGR